MFFCQLEIKNLLLINKFSDTYTQQGINIKDLSIPQKNKTKNILRKEIFK